jgi:hypothetical protein
LSVDFAGRGENKVVTFWAVSHSANAAVTTDSSPSFFAVSTSYVLAFWVESFACSSATLRARLSKTGEIKAVLMVETAAMVGLAIKDDGLVKMGRLVHLANIPPHH